LVYPVRAVGVRTERRRVYKWAAVILLLWLLFGLALGAARAASVTFDEGPHLAVGYATLRTGDMRLQPIHIHPPLANVIAAAPLLLDPDLPDPREVSGWEIASLSAVSDAVVWQYPQPARLAMAGRLPIILLTMLTAALVFRWAADLETSVAGLLALALYTLDPNVVAHGSLVTTDMAVTLFGLLAFFLLYRFFRHANWVRLFGVGLAVGLALAAKVSAVLILVLVAAILLFRRDGWGWWRRVGAVLFVSLVAFLALWAVYRFEIRSLPDVTGSIPLPAATHLEVYRSLQEHYRLGHPAFLMGQNGTQGWWLYFPVAFVVKTPLPILLLLGVALIIFISRRGPVHPTLILYPLVYSVTALFSSVDIGYRHLLPMLPFLYIFVGSQLGNAGFASRVTALWEERRLAVDRRAAPVARLLVIGIVVVWLAAGMVSVYPFPLTFFNELAGGPDGGYRWLVDSNLDWGQNLWQLRNWMKAEGVERVYYGHYSPARPQVYDVTADYLPPDPRALLFAPFDPAPGVYAIGATTLQGVYTPDVNTFAYFRSQEPDAVLGNALFVYRVPDHAVPDWAAVCFETLFSDQEVREGFGRPDLRLIFYDCAASQVYPAEGEGRYLLPPEADPPEGAALTLQARQADERPAYEIFGSGQRLAPGAATESVAVDGPLHFLGYQLDRSQAHPGQGVTLHTFWQVESAPDRPLSILAHLIGPDGTPVAVGDGLGVPVEAWQPGDVIVQRHTFQLPQDIPSGRYGLVTGAYWLDTMERWAVHDGAGNVSDRIELVSVEVPD
jgi:hypothetical protein